MSHSQHWDISDPLMKLPVLASALACVAFFSSCEKQDYAETRAFTHHGEHGSSHDSHGADGHAAKHAPTAEETPAKH